MKSVTLRTSVFLLIAASRIFGQNSNPPDWVDCGENHFPYGSAWFWQYVDGHYAAFMNHIAGLPQGSVERARLEARAAIIHDKYVDYDGPDSDFPDGLATCILNFGPHNPLSSEYVGQEIAVPFTIIVHPTFGYRTFLNIWDEVNVITNNGDDSTTFLVFSNAKDGSPGDDDVFFPSDYIKHWPKFQGNWQQRGPHFFLEQVTGYIAADYTAQEATFMGGRFGACVKTAMYSLVEIDNPANPNKDNHQPLTMHLPMNAIATQDWKNLEDEYSISDDTWDFLDLVENKLNPPTVYPGTTGILQGLDNRFHIITKINNVEVERKGGEPGPSVRTVTLDFKTKDGITPPKLPDLRINSLAVLKEGEGYGVTFKIENGGDIRIRHELAGVEYTLLDLGTGYVYSEEEISGYLGDVGESVIVTYHIPTDQQPPTTMTLTLDHNNRHYEKNEGNNSQTIATGW